MKKVVIIGVGIGADIIWGYLSSDKRYEIVAFAVDKEYITVETKFNLPIFDIEGLESKIDQKEVSLLMGIGYKDVNSLRATKFHTLKSLGFTFETYIHPSAVVHPSSEIGEGSMILSNSVVEPFAKIGENSLVWSNCTIAHHSQVKNHCWIASNTVISGEAVINDLCFIGVGCTIVNQLLIEQQTIIGAGCMITKSTKPNEVYLIRNAEKHRFDSINYAKFYIK